MKKIELHGKTIVLAAALAALSGCSMSRTNTRVEAPPPPACAELPAGVVREVWAEPMVDVIDVPPGLDPEGHYYRPAHREVVEIRQGRWQAQKP